MHNNQHRHNLFMSFNRNWIKWASASKHEWATYFDERKRRCATQQYYLSLSRIQVAYFTFVHARFIDLNPSCTNDTNKKIRSMLIWELKASAEQLEISSIN